MVSKRIPPAEKGKWHTSKWYRENFGVDPQKIGLPCKTVKNPVFSSTASMKLWLESAVAPHKNDKGIEKFKKRQEAGKKAFTTRRTKLIEFFKDAKGRNPRVQEITKRLWEVGNEINTLHEEKSKCRNADPEYDRREYFDQGFEHCDECMKRSGKQGELRGERQDLFGELEILCKADKKTIQLARKYLREDKGQKEDEKIGEKEVEPQRNLDNWAE